MFIYRIEDKYGNGPYGDKGCEVIDKYLNQTDFQHPSPFEDGIKTFTRKHFFGFKSLDQMFDWFEPIHDMWKDLYDYANCKLVEYQINEKYVTFGRHQIIFKKINAIKTKEFTKEEIFEYIEILN